jgi:ParB-like chromosome segregation protein Spo0J
MFPIHPVAALFPIMNDEELNDLIEDIRQNGQRENIVLDGDGQLLDGQNRQIACERLAIKPRTRIYEGGDPIAFIISMNVKRRHLSASQRAMIAAGIANLPLERPHKKPSNEGISQDTAAKLVNVSPASVERASVVRRDGADNVIAMVQRGDVSVTTVAAAVKDKPKSEQKGWTVDDVKKASRRGTKSATSGAATEKRFARLNKLLHNLLDEDLPPPDEIRKLWLQQQTGVRNSLIRDFGDVLARLRAYIDAIPGDVTILKSRLQSFGAPS